MGKRDAAGRTDMAFGRRIKENEKSLWFVFGLILLVLVGVLDYMSGVVLSYSVFYLVPIILLSWFVGRWAGLVAVVLSALDWYVAPMLSGEVPPRNSLDHWHVVLELVLFLLAIHLTTSLRRTLEKERRFARTDYRTGALNSRAFQEYTEREMARADRNHKPFTVAYVDLDDFKAINDRHGHSAGDSILLAVSGIIMRNVRGSDVFARIGGDEFALLLPECGSDYAPEVLERIRGRLRDELSGDPVRVTMSAGAVTFLDPPPSYDAMLEIVDALMYAVKRTGKDAFRHEVYSRGARTADETAPGRRA
jgi:diguanylate cyclase (GGDEF)-like protein